MRKILFLIILLSVIPLALIYFSKPKEDTTPSGFELINDRDLGYKLIKPIDYVVYDSNWDYHPGQKYKKSYGIYRIFKDPEMSVIDNYKQLVNTDNVIIYDKNNQDIVNDFSRYFPKNYEIYHPTLKSTDTYTYGEPHFRYLLYKENTKWIIYNPDFPDRYFVFNTNTITDEYKLESSEYLPNNKPWQASFRIIEGNSEFEYLKKSIGVPTNVLPFRINPLKFDFKAENNEWNVFTPGDQENGYNFNLVQFRSTASENNNMKNFLNLESTLVELKNDLKPKIIKLENDNDYDSLVINGQIIRNVEANRLKKEPYNFYLSNIVYLSTDQNFENILLGLDEHVLKTEKSNDRMGPYTFSVYKYKTNLYTETSILEDKHIFKINGLNIYTLKLKIINDNTLEIVGDNAFHPYPGCKYNQKFNLDEIQDKTITFVAQSKSGRETCGYKVE